MAGGEREIDRSGSYRFSSETLEDEARSTAPHRPGVLVADCHKFAIADPESASLRPVDLDELHRWDHPELEPVAGSAAVPPLPTLERRAGSILDSERPLILFEPFALRLDDHRVLAWDREQDAHVQLTRPHLELLQQFRTPTRSLDLLSEPAGTEKIRLMCELLALDLVRPASDADLRAARAEATAPPVEPPVEGPHVEPEPAVEGPELELEPAIAPDLGPTRPPAGPSSAGRALTMIRRLLGRSAQPSEGSDAQRRVIPAVDPAAVDPAAVDPAPVDPAAVEPAPVEPAPSEPARSEHASAESMAADPRVPVIPLYHFAQIVAVEHSEMIDPCLSIGSLFAYARSVDGGRLNAQYDFRRVSPHPDEAFEEWAKHPRPAVFVFSDYIWNVERHLELSRQIRELCPESIIVHGGPSSPKYEADTVEFFRANPAIDIAARGEGEHTFVEVLDRLDASFDVSAIERLADVEGITFRLRGGAAEQLVRTVDRERPTDLDEFPSPYLTGEFDLLAAVPWHSAAIETNRGCPYGCTFCDWGSATMSRIRKFDLERVYAELEWIAEHAPTVTLLVCDANFGILQRDVEIVERIVELKGTHPHIGLLIFAGLAKNTTKYTQQIFDLMVGAGIATMAASLAIQTTDPHVLEIANRTNIRLERYEELADAFASHKLPVMTDILFGMPGSTPDTFAADLQHCFDRGITARMFPLLMLPNSPMNEPGYRAEHEITVDDRGLVVGSSSFDAADYATMERLRLLFRASDHLGVLRHVLRYLQWDHGVPALEVLKDIDAAISERGNRYPLLSFYARLFDLYTVPPVGWQPFYDEVTDLVEERYGVQRDRVFESVIDTQLALMPAHGRTFPTKVRLEHDVFAYATANLERDAPRVALDTFGPVEFEVDDPTGVCSSRIQRNDFVVRREMESGNLFWIGLDWELASPAARPSFSNLHLFAESAP